MTQHEVTMIPTMVLAALWTVLTGDTFLPALTGAAFATYMRAQSKDAGVNVIDLVAGGAASLVIGLIAGPYVGSQLPNGDGVVGVGALIASFVAVGFFTRLHALDWNIQALVTEFGKAIGSALSRKK